MTDVSTICQYSSSESKWVVSRQSMVLNSGYWPDWSIKLQFYCSSVCEALNGYEDSKCDWCVLIRQLSELNSRLVSAKLSVVQSFSRSWFSMSLSIKSLVGCQ